VDARLRVALYRDGAARVADADTALALSGHETRRLNVEGMLGSFVDAAWAYRFGPPAQHAIVATLYDAGEGSTVISQAFHFPAGRPVHRRPAAELGLRASAGHDSLLLQSDRLVYGMRIAAPGFAAADDAFSLEPGVGRAVALHRLDADAKLQDAVITALNLDDQVRPR
jgi:beta-mannosidase